MRLFSLGKKSNPGEDLLNNAKKLVNEKKWTEASEAFEAYLQKEPSNYRTRMQLVTLYLHLGNHDKAREHLTQLDPTQVDQAWQEKHLAATNSSQA